MIAYGALDQDAKTKLLIAFVKWTLDNFPNVIYVTNQQLIKWIQTPVPMSKISTFFTCDKADPSLGAIPKARYSTSKDKKLFVSLSVFIIFSVSLLFHVL